MARTGNFAELLGSRAGLRELKELPVALYAHYGVVGIFSSQPSQPGLCGAQRQ